MIEKLFYILQIIKEETSPISAKMILERLAKYQIHIDIKTVYSTIDAINELSRYMNGRDYIQTIRARGYIISKDYFDDGQLRFLLDSIKSNPNLNEEEQNHLFEQLLKLSSQSQKNRVGEFSGDSKDEDLSLLLNLTTIISAINSKKTISFQYINYDVDNHQLIEVNSENGNRIFKGKKHYVISPYQIHLQGGNYYVVGYFDKRKDQLSIYRIDRMRHVMKSSDQFVEIREQFDMEKEFQQMIQMHISNQKIDLTFRFHPSITREVVNQFGKNIEVSKEYDGWIYATIKEINNTRGLLGWIFMLQDQIEIIEPVELRSRIRELLIKMTQTYKG